MKSKTLSKRRVAFLSSGLVLFIIAFILLTLPGSGIKPSDIHEITIQDSSGNITRITDRKGINQIVDAVNSARPVQDEVLRAWISKYQLRLGSSGGELPALSLWVNRDLASKEMWITDEKAIRQVLPEYFNAILVNAAFDPIYPQNSPPGLSVILNDTPIRMLPSQYQWQIRKTDQAYHQVHTDYIKGNEVYSLEVNQDSVLKLDFETPPDLLMVDIHQDGVTVYSAQSLEGRLPLTRDGLYQATLRAVWQQNDSRDFYGEAEFEFELKADLPPTFDFSASEIDPGELLVIRVSNVNAENGPEISTQIDFKPSAFKAGDTWMILLPVSYFHEANKDYTISVSADGIKQEHKLRVKPKEFTVQYLKIDPNVAQATRNEDSAKEMQAKVYPLKPIIDEQKYWEGLFLQPVEGGRVTPADFGKRRYVNNAPTSYRHNGLDIGQDTGTPVMASNSGRVLLAEYLIETGYTVIIEHGYGLKTWYYHMSELKTKAGDMVNKGDIIGLVGSTGFSTGPHLHFSASVNSIWINPLTLINEGVPLFPDTED